MFHILYHLKLQLLIQLNLLKNITFGIILYFEDNFIPLLKSHRKWFVTEANHFQQQIFFDLILFQQNQIFLLIFHIYFI